MKKSVVCLVLILLMSGCNGGSHKEISYDSFLLELEDLGYELVNVGEEQDVAAYFVAPFSRYHFLTSEFSTIGILEGENEEATNELFLDYVDDRIEAFDETNSSSIVENDSTMTYTLETDEYYIFVGMKDHTILAVSSMKSESGILKEFVESYEWK